MAFKFELVLFDNDNTAQCTERVAFVVIANVFNAYLAQYGQVAHAAELQRRYAGLQVPEICAQEFEKLGVPKDPAIIQALNQRTIELIVPAMEQYAEPTLGMHEAADILVWQKRKLALVTSSERRRVQAGLQKTRLNKFFPAMNFEGGNIFTVPDSLPVAGLPPLPKPNPSICHLAVKDMNVRRQNCIAVEDSAPGVKSWVDAGIRVIGYTGADPLTDAEIGIKTNELMMAGAIGVIHHMDCLPTLIRTIENRINRAYANLRASQRKYS